MREKKITWGKSPSDNISLDDCEWYHIMEVPGIDGLTNGTFDCREDIDNIFGNLDFKNKKVLNLGPITGYLNFEAEIYSCVTWYNPKSKKVHYVHRFHRDPDDFKFLTMIIYWNKTDQLNGCLIYLKKSHNSTVSEEKKDFLTGPKGQVYLADLFGLHAGSKILDKYRYVTQIKFGKLHNHCSTIDGFVLTPKQNEVNL